MVDMIALAIIMAVTIGIVAGYLGSLMISKRMALVGGALGHLTLPGIAVALIYGFDVSLGALTILILGICLIWLFELRTKLPMEALTAVVFATSVGVAFLFLPEEHTVQALIGDISQITIYGTILVVLLSALVFFIVRKILPGMVLAGISEDLAKVQGVDIKRYNLIYLACIAITVALGVRIVGGLLTAALVAIPAATSRNLSINLKQYSYGSALLGGVSCALGVLGWYATNIPAGPLIIVIGGISFLLSLIFKRK